MAHLDKTVCYVAEPAYATAHWIDRCAYPLRALLVARAFTLQGLAMRCVPCICITA